MEVFNGPNRALVSTSLDAALAAVSPKKLAHDSGVEPRRQLAWAFSAVVSVTVVPIWMEVSAGTERGLLSATKQNPQMIILMQLTFLLSRRRFVIVALL